MHMYRIIAVHVGAGCASVRPPGNLFFHKSSLRDAAATMPDEGDQETFLISKQNHKGSKQLVAVGTD